MRMVLKRLALLVGRSSGEDLACHKTREGVVGCGEEGARCMAG
jgi:hypothetical protein